MVVGEGEEKPDEARARFVGEEKDAAGVAGGGSVGFEGEGGGREAEGRVRGLVRGLAFCAAVGYFAAGWAEEGRRFVACGA